LFFIYDLNMGNLYTRVSEVMDKIYEDSVFSVDREEELAKLLKENFEDCYKKALTELENPEEEIPSPGQIVGYIEQLPEAEQAKALAIVNNWFDNLED
jgi:hypothetical protein